MPATPSLPLVTVGFPVYNGGKTFIRALESVLSQDYPNLEVIVSDNGSTDGTEEVCRGFAAKDPRVTYVRQPVNRGPSWNFNYVVGRATGKYFVRMSHDDIRAPAYVRKCVALLEEHPAAVLCHSYTAAFYGDPSNVLSILTHDDVVGESNPRRRFMRALRYLPAPAFEGLFRTDALRAKTRLLGDYLSSDIVLTHELMLHGDFVQVPEVLFWRSGKAILPPPQDVSRFLGNARETSRFRPPIVTLVWNHLRSVWRSGLGWADRLLLSGQIVAHECGVMGVKVAFRAATGLMGARCPAWLLRLMIRTTANPSVRILKDPLDLPPVLHPTWRLLNHRNMEKALALQRKLDEKLYRSPA